MITSLLLALVIVTPVGVPSSVREGCERQAIMVERIKTLQISHSTVAEVLEELDKEGYQVEGREPLLIKIIEVTFAELITPAEFRKQVYAACLKLWENE
jgi:hypothetical protein